MMPYFKYRAIWARWVVRRIFEWGYLGGERWVGPLSYPPNTRSPSLNHGGYLSTGYPHSPYGSAGLSTGYTHGYTQGCGLCHVEQLLGAPNTMCRSSHVTIVTSLFQSCDIRHKDLTSAHLVCPRIRMRSKRSRGGCKGSRRA
jgi:hypothetical protein